MENEVINGLIQTLIQLRNHGEPWEQRQVPPFWLLALSHPCCCPMRQHREHTEHLYKYFQIYDIAPPKKLAQEMAKGYFIDIPLHLKWYTSASIINERVFSCRSFHMPSTMLTMLVHEHWSLRLPWYIWKGCCHYTDREGSER